MDLHSFYRVSDGGQKSLFLYITFKRKRLMNKIALTGMLLLCCSFAFSQNSDLQKEINEQVWKPFIKAIGERDNEALSAVHSREVIRVIQDDERIIGYDEYFKKVPDSMKATWKDWQSTIELRFLQRIASADKAFETGYYKTTSANSRTGERRTSYGKFHVLLRKENGAWKILMDADANENTDEMVFMTAKPME
jgi:ketosteroid isomerase-like protein